MKSSHKHSDAPAGRARYPWGLEVMTIVALATPVDQREAAFVRVRAQGCPGAWTWGIPGWLAKLALCQIDEWIDRIDIGV